MTSSNRHPKIKLVFESTSLRIPLADIETLRDVSGAVRASMKYGQIAASIREVGIIEPPVVVRLPGASDRYRLLDGHLRLDILRERGDADVVCLVATDDEAITYNKRINRIATVQEHKMILRAIEQGVSPERLARALNVNIGSIRNKRRLLDGICDEVVKLLEDRMVPILTFQELRKLRPMRQIEVAETMIAMNRYSRPYAQSLVAATPQSQLVDEQRKVVRGLSDEQIDHMEREASNIDREFRMVEQSYGTDHLDLVLAMGYVCRLIENLRIVHHLAKHHPELLAEFQRIALLRNAA
ncbi:plasmid partitioning protein RepB C-terminal domain-containing protein [Sphingopyxis sp. RIFCSPHIGHO2_12_FULL_65_19]|uniref:plasmid partitioning protein RepB C-terminal domain-containing protein n=1 Tax=Sphingopyxis sp. RIFCSPHIGHO2_12_FULL_65_19 TaxID=1802172 RepID=UPI0008C0B14D|nr:plasmid partitioning protein RepB C-terminal domain-containing protein [Sphingopyxis sp. RIFCSPHIGHO2_12_FULL_65_19]OHD05240.1 MAG: chromosome partitioning protein ParB [Sphingopyxis sp. RIFCSPHIGHO2_12_FULL_65_19]